MLSGHFTYYFGKSGGIIDVNRLCEPGWAGRSVLCLGEGGAQRDLAGVVKLGFLRWEDDPG